MRAASGLILAPSGISSSRGANATDLGTNASGQRTDLGAKRTSKSSHAAIAGASASEGQVSNLKPGGLVEVRADFKSAEKTIGGGKIEGTELRRGQRGKLVKIDDDGDAYVSFVDHKRTVIIAKAQLENLKCAIARPEASGSESPADMKAYDALVDRQQAKLSSILKELRTAKRKTSCWAWWVFPTEKEGMCDPDGTRVTISTAGMLLSNSSTVDNWQLVLECICDLVEEHGMGILPRIDHGRVHWFIRFWSQLEASPEWMRNVCKRLNSFKWPQS